MKKNDNVQNLLKVLVAFCCIFFSTIAYANDDLQSIFPNGEIDVSTAAQLTFQSQFPINLPENLRFSPVCYDNSGERLQPKFYIVPTDYLNDTSYINFYAVRCQLFISDSTPNLITIIPLRPFDNNRSYSVVFQDFPILRPNINSPNGYESDVINKVFYDIFTTIDYPTHVAEMSFDRTGGRLWCKDNSIIVNFNRPIYVSDSAAQTMFEIKQVGNLVQNPDNTVSFGEQLININVVLAGDKKSAEIIPISPLEYGGDYWFSTNFDNYLGNSDGNNNYHFSVSNEIIISVEAYSPLGDVLSSKCVNAGFSGYRRYQMGDTAYLHLPGFDSEYYLAEWELPEGTIYEVSEDGEQLKLIFDCRNFFSNSQGNAAIAALNGDLTIRAKYLRNPIDTLRIPIPHNPAIAAVCPEYRTGLQVENCIAQISEDMFTYYRYSYLPLVIDYIPSESIPTIIDIPNGNVVKAPVAGLTSTIHLNLLGTTLGNIGGSGGTIQVKLSKPAHNMISPMAISNGSTTLLNIQNGTVTIGGGIYVKIDETLNPRESDDFSVVVHLDGASGSRSFEQNLVHNPMALFSNITLYGRSLSLINLEPPDDDNCTAYSTQIIGVNSELWKPAKVGFNITLSHPDYEIYLVHEDYYLYRCILNPGLYIKKNYYGNGDIYYNYTLVGDNSVSGMLEASHFYRKNRLHIHVRRKIAQYCFSVVIEEMQASPKTKAVPPFDIAKLKFNTLEPLMISKSINASGNTEYYQPFLNFHSSVYDGYYIRDGIHYGTAYNYGPDRRTCEIPVRSNTSVIYFSGESFTAVPYFKENTGYSFKKYDSLSNAHNNYQDLNQYMISIQNIKDDGQCCVLLGEEDFRLDYIGIPKVGGNIGDVKYFRIDDITSNINYPLWNDKYLLDPDNGAEMNTEYSGNNNLQRYTTSLNFAFNKDYNVSTLKNNITISDIRKYKKDIINEQEGYFRDDGEYVVENYLYDSHTTANYMAPGYTIWHVELKEPNTICHLQPFRVNINNFGGSILSADGEELSNISKNLEEGVSFDACTSPPGIAIWTEEFHNYTLEDTHGGNIEAIITGFSISDKGTLTVKDVNSFVKINPDGRVDYRIVTPVRFPVAGYEELGKNTGFSYNTRVEVISKLFYKQRIMLNYHWVDDDVPEIWPFGSLGICNDIVGLTYNSELAALVFALIGMPEIGVVAVPLIEKIGEVVKKALCDSKNKYLDHNDFWLNYEGNQNYALIDEAGEKLSWNLWGVGKYKMYTGCSKPTYGKSFKIKYNPTTLKYEIKTEPSSKVLMHIRVGDL